MKREVNQTSFLSLIEQSQTIAYAVIFKCILKECQHVFTETVRDVPVGFYPPCPECGNPDFTIRLGMRQVQDDL